MSDKNKELLDLLLEYGRDSFCNGMEQAQMIYTGKVSELTDHERLRDKMRQDAIDRLKEILG